MTGFDDALYIIFTHIYPDPILCGLIAFAVFVCILLWWKIPRSTSAHALFLFVWVMSSGLGGSFVLLKDLLLAATGIGIILAYMKLGNR